MESQRLSAGQCRAGGANFFEEYLLMGFAPTRQLELRGLPIVVEQEPEIKTRFAWVEAP